MELFICISVNMYEYAQYMIQSFIHFCFYILKVNISLEDAIDHGSVNRASEKTTLNQKRCMQTYSMKIKK